MPDNNNAKVASSTKSSGIKPIVAVGVGCLILLFIVGTAISLGLKFFAKKAGTAQTVNIGGEKLPDTFPKDFPIYPGAKIVSSVSNTQQGKGNGLLVTFTAPDGHGLDKVVPFYKSGLATGGWTITSSFDSDTIQTWAIAKGTTEGSVSITTSERDPLTIVVTLGEKE